MILVDANLLVYAQVSSFRQHEAAREWLDQQLNGPARVGMPWPSLLAFVRLVSNPRVFEQPALISDAWRQVQSWLDRPSAWIPLPTDQHRTLMSRLLMSVGNRSNLVPDAHLAALALEHGLLLCSADGDFARFPGLRWQDPLAASA